MPDPQQNRYLRDAVMTATPEQLQLMLFDGAIRFSMQARDAIQKGDVEQSYNLLMKAQRIVREMENGLQHEVSPELCSRMAALYNFVFSKLVDANVNKNVDALDDALRILRHQRETWAMLVEKIQHARAEQEPAQEETDSTPTQHDSLSIEG